MKVSNMKVMLLPHTPFLKEDGKFDLKKAMNYQGKLGGICYSEEGLVASFIEDYDKTEKRVEMMTSGEHQSVFEHVNIGLYLQNVPKFLNMILNNEHQYSTSERSLRYTSIKDNGEFPKEVIDLYNKWNLIFFDEIKKVYGNCKTDKQIMKLAQENSRYLMPVTMSTEMVHTIPLAQLNRVVNYMMDYVDNGLNGEVDELHEQMRKPINDFISTLYDLGVIDDRLISNRKHRKLSIFGENLSMNNKEFGEVYSTTYKGSFAQLAQAHRHRTIYYQMERTPYIEYFIPPIIRENYLLSAKWLNDMEIVNRYGIIPQGEMVLISEKGTYDTFKLKMKERLCSAAQLEVAQQTEKTRDEWIESLKEKSKFPSDDVETEEKVLARYGELYTDLNKYKKGARCTFPDYDCPRDCKFNEGKILQRKI